MKSNHFAKPSSCARYLMVAAAFAASCSAGLALGQTAGGHGTNHGAATAAGVVGEGAQLQRADRKLIEDIVQANLAEIETSRIALDTSRDERVRKFAQAMIDDHTAAMKEVQSLAQIKGVALPDGLDLKHKTMATALKAMSGETFDRQYMSHAGVGDHQKTLDLLQKTQREAKDPQLKALAVKMIPVVQGHLAEAQRVAPAMRH